MEEIASGIKQLDTFLGGLSHLTAGFLVEGPQPALIETGSQTSAKTVIDELNAAGVDPKSLRWLVVTHIHLDHAGAVGDVAAAFPNATIVVHEKGARHLIDPSRLIDSASRVYGPLLDSVYGRMIPVESDRVLAAADGQLLDIGNGRKLRLVDSPGHAKHHHAVFDEQTGTLLVGDAVGVQLPDVPVGLRPATPPPDFDLEHAVASLHKFAELKPSKLVLTHYGPVDDAAHTLDEAEAGLYKWVSVAEAVLQKSADAGIDDVANAFIEEFSKVPDGMPEKELERFELLNGMHSNAAGILRYLQQRQAVQTS